LFSSVVAALALNPLLLPAAALALLLTLSRLLTRWPVVRTLLYISAVMWSQAVIWTIRAVAPLCFAYVACALLSWTLPSPYSGWLPVLHGALGAAVLVYAVVEVCFYFHQMLRCRRLQRRVAGPPFPQPRRWLMFRRVEEASQCVAPMAMPRNCTLWRRFHALRNNNNSSSGHTGLQDDERHPLEFLRGWFFNVDLQHVRHDNLLQFFAESHQHATCAIV
jgi:hypothetical protein